MDKVRRMDGTGWIWIFLFVCVLIFAVCMTGLADWALETVDDVNTNEAVCAVSGTGEPHLVYCSGGLWYTRRDGGTWQRELVDGEDCAYVSLELDSAGRPHISYYDYTNHDLKYAWYDGTNWRITTVDSDGFVGRYTSLALDSADRPHISYYDYTNHDLKYAWYDGTDWRITTVDSDGFVGRYTSLALDSADRPHISYYDDTNGELKYAWYDGTNWQITTVDSDGDVGQYTSLALDSADRPHISYYDYTNHDLKYARYEGETWLVTTVDAAGYVGEYTALALAPDGAVHIGYKGTLKHASMRPAPPGTAVVFRVDRATGNVLADGAFYGLGFYSGSADVAEWVPVSEPVEPGDVLEIDPENPGHYRKARGPCSQLVVGVVSTEPGFVLGHGEDTEGKALLALIGIVPVKVTDEGGPIRPGDLLVVSSTPGYAMRWDPDSGLCGFVGKALEPWEGDEGVILVLLMR